MAAVLDGVWRRRTGLVRREVLTREEASECADVVGDDRGELAVIQHLRAVARDRLQRAREIGLEEAVGRLETGRRAVRCAALAVVHALRLGVLVQTHRGRAEDERAVPVHDHPVPREPDRRLEQARPGQLPEPAVRHLVRGDGAGDADRERTLDVRVVLHRRPAVHSGTRVAPEKLEHLGP